MTIETQLLEQVRARASFACEYCGVTETDTGGQLTVDHFQPQSQQGSDDPDNLLYCCYRCNLYKADYWPTEADDPVLWNPRQNAITTNLLTLADGVLHPITPTGKFTLRRLRLNRTPLVEYRRRKLHHDEEVRLLSRYHNLLMLLEQLHQQQVSLLDEHRALLEEQRALLRLLTNGN